jgi:condensin complex subunit 2
MFTNIYTFLQGPKKFSDIIEELPERYPEKKLGDISVAFCFICLLHLANEKGLKVDGNNSLQDLSIEY